jgi:hypothetical protein
VVLHKDTTGNEPFEVGLGEFVACSAYFGQHACMDYEDDRVQGVKFAWMLVDWDHEGRLSQVQS